MKRYSSPPDSLLANRKQTTSERVRKLAHRVKGAGGGYNFHTVTAMGRAIESRAVSGDLPGAARVIAQLDEYLSIVKWKPGAALPR